MNLAYFQAACVPVLLLAYGFILRNSKFPALTPGHAAALVFTSWLGEQTCIEAYSYYRYSDDWWLKIGHVPLLVPIIWPLVILSAREVVTNLFPKASSSKAVLLLSLFVVIDASLIEVVAVASGFWAWNDSGYIGVPFIGILGWGFYAFGAGLFLEARSIARKLAALALIVPITHVLIQIAWWSFFRQNLRETAGLAEGAPFIAGAISVAFFIGRTRKTSKGLQFETVVPRLLASSLFLGLLFKLTNHQSFQLIALQVALVALPYCLATNWKSLVMKIFSGKPA